MIKRIVVLMMSVGLCASLAHAAITVDGDVYPYPEEWSDEDCYIGDFGDGSVTVDDDSEVVSGSGYLGYESGSTGVVTPCALAA